MENKIKAFIQQEKLFINHCPIIVGVSGGVDSVCLLYLLHTLGYATILAHINHHKREQSILEQAEMKKFAEKLNIPFELSEFYDNGEDNFQKKAREARYTFFKGLAFKYHTEYIATAHHLDDQVETILMHILNGSNLYGYGGISISYQEENYQIVRPLLCCSKDELYAYAKQKKLPYFEDSSNQEDDYLRNRLRHHIVPRLKELQPDLLNKVQEFSIQTKEAFDFIRKQSINYLDKLNNNISTVSFSLLERALQKDILCLLFERYHLEKNKETIENCLRLIEENKNKTIDLKRGYFFSVEYKMAHIEQKKEKTSFEELVDIDKPCIISGKYRFYFSKKIPQNNAIYIKLCYNSLKLPFLIRNRKKGDFIEMSYGNKKVARIMIDAKVPVNKREQIPLIFDNEGTLLWIYNLAKSNQVAKQKSKGDIYLVCEEVEQC